MTKNKTQTSKVETSSRRATYQDVLDAPPHMVAEVVDGTLYTFPRPAMTHALAGSVLGGIINPSFQFGRGGPGGWWILDEPELHLDEDIVVPDIAGWRRERMPECPTGAFCTLAPDWVCEVLSPYTRKLDLGGKWAVYARAGVCFHWFVDPDTRLLEAFVLRGAERVLIDRHYGEVTVSLPPFDAIQFNLGDLWPPPTAHRETPRVQSELESTEVLK